MEKTETDYHLENNDLKNLSLTYPISFTWSSPVTLRLQCLIHLYHGPCVFRRFHTVVEVDDASTLPMSRVTTEVLLGHKK